MANFRATCDYLKEIDPKLIDCLIERMKSDANNYNLSLTEISTFDFSIFTFAGEGTREDFIKLVDNWFFVITYWVIK